jgi:hypothetical protein
MILVDSTTIIESGADLYITKSALDNLSSVFKSLDTLGMLLTEIDVFEKLLALALLTMAIRTVMMLHFHPKMGFISNTMAHAMKELSLFIFVFLMLVAFYGVIGNLLMGNDADGFRTVGSAISSLMFAAVGEIGFVYDVMLVFESYPTLTQLLVGLYFWSFIVLTAILLLNVLLSIIMESFMRAQEINSSSAVLQFSAVESVVFWLEWRRFDVENYVIPRIKGCCLGVKRKKAATKQPPKKIPYPSFVISNSDPSARDRFQQPIRYSKVLSLLKTCSDWRTPCFVYRYEFKQVFSQKVADRLVAMFRNHGTQRTMKEQKDLKQHF